MPKDYTREEYEQTEFFRDYFASASEFEAWMEKAKSDVYMLRQKQRNVTPRVQKQVMNVLYARHAARYSAIKRYRLVLTAM